MTWLLLAFSLVWADDGYKKPPQQILDVLNAPSSPQAIVSPTHNHLLLIRSRRYPPISEIAQPMLRLAGVRVNPRTNGLHNGLSFVEYTLIRIADGKQIPLKLPPSAMMSIPRWSPDGRYFAFTNTTADSISLWIGEAESGTLHAVPSLKVNGAMGETVHWLPGSQRLLVRTVPNGRPQPPREPVVPSGPKIQESAGKYAPVRTYQDLLTSDHDMDLFDYYMTSQWMMVDVQSMKSTFFGDKAVYMTIDPSPDGSFVLFQRLHRPYSLLHTYNSFPKDIGVWDGNGHFSGKLFVLPLEDSVPIEGVSTGPRFLSWRPDVPATLFYVEALDGGDPRKKVPHRDRLMSWKAPFSGYGAEWTKLENRFAGIEWGKGFAIIRDQERQRRWTQTLLWNTKDTGVAPKVIASRSSQDRYRDPGTAVEEVSSTGHRMLLQDGDAIFRNGLGATPQGARPFLDRYDVKTAESKRLFRSAEQGYERVLAVLGPDQFLTEKEDPSTPPNYFVRSSNGASRALTHFVDPTPQVRKITKQLVTYKRPDGVNLSFTLYLPPDYQPGTRLPTVVWAYPREFADADTAGQFAGSTQHFTTLTGPTHLFYLLAGYAVLDDASMPVVGDPETVNNTYVEQIVASAKAAIDKAAEMGVTDPARVGVGGHSYGAFMTANLLAHSDLFRAGVARSGAYNRTLTPFGFQSEHRTFWEAPELYLRMSPFVVAQKINEPILLIHGEADNNPGTFPIQSDRMYQAVRGNGGTVRLVFLPHEAHGYAARESIEHTLAEMLEWFDKHVKNAGTKDRPASPAGQ